MPVDDPEAPNDPSITGWTTGVPTERLRRERAYAVGSLVLMVSQTRAAALHAGID